MNPPANRTETLRDRAARHIVYPLTRDECLELLATLDATEQENKRLKDALRVIGCLDEHYCPGSPYFFVDDEDKDKFTRCVRCEALSSGGDT